MNRRHFLASVSATAILPMPTFAAEDTLRLKAEAVTQQILPDGNGVTSMLGFNGSMPGHEPDGWCADTDARVDRTLRHQNL